MRKIFLCSFIQLCLIVSANSQSYSERLDSAYSLLRSDFELAKEFTLTLLDDALKDNDLKIIVKSNFTLGYIEEKNKDFGKSVIYYLEAIRYAGKTDYQGIQKDQISLRKNLANIFRTFKANSLATKYNLEAISIAEKEAITTQIVNLNRNQGLVYQDAKDFGNAIKCYERVLELGNDEDKYRTINQIGLVYLDSKDYVQAKATFESLLDIPAEYTKYSAKALHNLGEIHYALGEKQKSIEFLKNSIALKHSLTKTDYYSLFNSYRSIGRYLFEVNGITEAEEYLLEAEKIFSHAEWDQRSYEIFKTLSNLYYTTNDNILGQKYSELYYDKVQEYLDTQNEIQQQDKEYNFDLITKRYFDKVESQERIASILQTSKISIGGLLVILFLTVGYHRFEKIRMRRNIERELASLNLFED